MSNTTGCTQSIVHIMTERPFEFLRDCPQQLEQQGNPSDVRTRFGRLDILRDRPQRLYSDAFSRKISG